jgi:tryptophanyl-tRNA synthetase
MSKSENNMSTLYFADDNDTIKKKVMKALTDGGPTEMNSKKPDYIENIFSLMKLVCATEVIEKFESDFNNCTIRYGDLKKQLAEDMINFISPIREKTNDILANDAYLVEVMEKGANKARESARKTMDLVRNAMGLNYF